MTSEQALDTALTEVLLRQFPRLVIPKVINRVRGARSFNAAEFYMRPLVPYFASLDPAEATALAQAAIENSQVWVAALCRTEYLPQFLRLNRHQISPDQFTALASKIEYNDSGE